mgnify:CR=1 FL=1
MTFAKKARALAITMLIMTAITVLIFFVCYRLHLLWWLLGFYVFSFAFMFIEMKKRDKEFERRENKE